MYKATINLRDTQDKDHLYKEGETFPREGLEVSEERLKDLLEKGFIVEVKAKKKAETKAEPKEKAKSKE